MQHRLALVLILFASCMNNAKEENKQADTIAQSSLILPDAFQYLEKKDSIFSPQQFLKNPEEQTTIQEQERPLTKETMDYQKLFIYNKDSSKAIDLFSYGTLLHRKNGRDYIEGGEPDTEVGLIDFRKDSRRRIYFAGPSITLFDAKWINDSIIALAGAHNIDEEHFHPFVLQMNLAQNKCRLFPYKDTLQLDVKDLLQYRFPGVVFQ